MAHVFAKSSFLHCFSRKTNPCVRKGAHVTKVFVVRKHVRKIEMKTKKWNHHLVIIKPQIASTIKKGHLPLPNDSLTKTTYISVEKKMQTYSSDGGEKWWWIPFLANPLNKNRKWRPPGVTPTNNLMCWFVASAIFGDVFVGVCKTRLQNPFAKWVEDPCIHYSWQSKGAPTMPPSN